MATLPPAPCAPRDTGRSPSSVSTCTDLRRGTPGFLPPPYGAPRTRTREFRVAPRLLVGQSRPAGCGPERVARASAGPCGPICWLFLCPRPWRSPRALLLAGRVCGPGTREEAWDSPPGTASAAGSFRDVAEQSREAGVARSVSVCSRGQPGRRRPPWHCFLRGENSCAVPTTTNLLIFQPGPS